MFQKCEQSTLVELSKKIRGNVLRAILKSKASHVASAMSIVDILTVLYGKGYVTPEKKQFFLSKGHAGVAVYSTLRAIDVITEEIFDTYYGNCSYLGGHISHKQVPGVHLSTGSLGGGIAVANGVALANKLNGNNDYVYVIVGDGECEEGSIWEAALFAGHHQLNYLTVIVDRNYLQGCGFDKEIIHLGDLGKKFAEFGWQVVDIDGHCYEEIDRALSLSSDKPRCIVANTTKGKGVSFMENNNLWHYRNVAQSDYELALVELGVAFE